VATTQDPKTVAFVLYPGITLLDMVDPLQVFSVLGGFNDQYQPVVVAERIEPMPTDTPLTVTADKTFAAALPKVEGEPKFPTNDQIDAVKKVLAESWSAATSG